MNIKFLFVIITLSLCFIFGFEKISYGFTKENNNNISELKVLTFLPKNNRSLFLSNEKPSKIKKIILKNYKTKDQEKFILIKNSILAYLGMDIGENKLEEIYNNELLISTFDNKEKDMDDLLIIFKIKETKDIDDILNLTNKIDEPNKLIKIFRKNKLNYLKYIYRTNDNYILTSTNKKLIIDALQSKQKNQGKENQYIFFTKLFNNLKNQNNVLLTKNFRKNELLNNSTYPFTKDDYILTLFDFKNKEIIAESYLINNQKNLDFNSYETIDKVNILEKSNYQIATYNEYLNSKKYLNQIKINRFENSILNGLNEKLKNNKLLLVSGKNWIIIYDKNNLSIDKTNLLEGFNKNSIENNNNTYTIYSKDGLKKEDDIIKQSDYKKIFLVQSKNFNFVSNSLLSESDIDLISQEFMDFKDYSNAKYFLNKKINLKNPFSIQTINFSYLKTLNYFLKNIVDISIIEFKAIIKQSIPETTPVYYAKTNFKLI